MSKEENNVSFGSFIFGILFIIGVIWFVNVSVPEPDTQERDRQYDNYEAEYQKIVDEFEQEQATCEKKYDILDGRLTDCYEQAKKNRDLKSKNLKMPY